jgi:signal transduction histidine kinase
VGLAGSYIGLVLILSLVKKIKNGTFFKQSCIVIFFNYLYRVLFQSGSTMRKVVLGAVVIVLLSATVVLAPVVLIVILVFAPRFVNKVDAIKEGLDEVGSGNLAYKIPLDESKNGELEEIARGINQISEGSHMAVQNEIKNQRMKTELISNVSHDLKTPLTSLVTYIDLLKTEGLTSKNAPEYLDVLENKTNRLCVLTDNLFEAAKAASGAMPVKLEKVELVSLVNQSLGEMNQRIQDSELEFILNNKEENYFVWADGSLMWRVMENILGNALKYALPNTRVYLDIKEGNGKDGQNSDIIQLEMKNVSKESLNMDPSELMERFTQGDESRNSEGSGLGLSITKDLMKIQNGWFEIKIDGDLFKCIVVLNKYKEEA